MRCDHMVRQAEESRGKRYSTIMVSRNDYVWLSTHPSLEVLDRHNLYVLQKNRYYLHEGHLVGARHIMGDLLRFWETLTSPTPSFLRFNDHYPMATNEHLLGFRLGQAGYLYHRVVFSKLR